MGRSAQGALNREGWSAARDGAVVALAADLGTRLVLDMAVTTRKPADVVEHGDRGSQCTSLAFGTRCRDAGMRPSSGAVGGAHDNAMAEAFFATFARELFDRRRLRSEGEARIAVFHAIVGFYSPTRRHASFGRLSRVEFEARTMLMKD